MESISVKLKINNISTWIRSQIVHRFRYLICDRECKLDTNLIKVLERRSVAGKDKWLSR